MCWGILASRNGIASIWALLVAAIPKVCPPKIWLEQNQIKHNNIRWNSTSPSKIVDIAEKYLQALKKKSADQAAQFNSQ